MSAQSTATDPPTPDTAPSPPHRDPSVWSDRPLVVVGTGPVGVRFTREFLRLRPGAAVVVYGAEPWAPYNRVKLSHYLSGELDDDELASSSSLPDQPGLVTRYNQPIAAIDRKRRWVIDQQGNRQPYSALVLATGSRPHVPAIDGIQLPGVYTFRDKSDAVSLMARRARARLVVIIGGGLLGLEAARAMQRLNTRVTVIEHSSHLMFNQLDGGAGARLRRQFTERGIEVRCNEAVSRVLGQDAVEGVLLRSGEELPADTLIVAAGIRPNVDLAYGCKLSVGRGIRVDDQLRSSDANIYAIGECAEHRNRVYGLVAPGFEQAQVAAHNLAERQASYSASIAPMRLKLVDTPVFSIGQVVDGDQGTEQLLFEDSASGAYRKLFLRGQRVSGVVALGEWDELSRIQEAVTHARRLWPWQLLRFRQSGRLWPEGANDNIAEWPATATVCNCTGVTRGQLTSACGTGPAGGCATLDELSERTGAGRVCGSCKPLLAQLLGTRAALPPEPGFRQLAIGGLLGLLVTLAFLFAPSIPYNGSAQDSLQWDPLWRDGLAKQLSGFSLLGAALLLALLALRKRITRFTWGAFATWRWLHVALGLLTLVLLLAHTGARLGHGLNLALMLSFIGLSLTGAVAAGVIGSAHHWGRAAVRRARGWSLWGHLLLLWPIPALLGLHVLKTYWF